MRYLFAGALFSSFLAAITFVAPVVQGQEVGEAERTGGGKPFHCPKYCKFPPHSQAKCSIFKPCGFDCKDGYQPFPILLPIKCICPWPLTECNGKCGKHKACPSKGNHKRDILPSQVNCPSGYTACGILGRATGSWECINTQRDLESCGGCLVSVTNELNKGDGQDCTAIEGVSDVSCIDGACVVQKCMAGYEPDAKSGSCVPLEREKSALFSVAKDILAAEFGA